MINPGGLLLYKPHHIGRAQTIEPQLPIGKILGEKTTDKWLVDISFGLGLMTRKEIKLCRVRLRKFESSTSAGQSARHSQELGIVWEIMDMKLLET
ncbi:MAG: hypothetical protein Q8O64_04495 [Sideroxyarcus sp.]|jgi:hypothetical protein|nr:hypothetical protein [Sideroxyarcus sp.]